MNPARKGFTVVELMIVLTILVILAAIAIPSLLRGRMSSNEARAAALLKSYATAQDIWRKSSFGAVAGNNFTYSAADSDFAALNSGPRSFADNFRNLYYAYPARSATRRVELVSKGMADAFYPGANESRLSRSAAAVTTNADGAGDGMTVRNASQAYYGYVFAEDRFIETGASGAENDAIGWNLGYGLIAYPVAAGKTGDFIFGVGFNLPVSHTSRKPTDATGELPALFGVADSMYSATGEPRWTAH